MTFKVLSFLVLSCAVASASAHQSLFPNLFLGDGEQWFSNQSAGLTTVQANRFSYPAAKLAFEGASTPAPDSIGNWMGVGIATAPGWDGDNEYFPDGNWKIPGYAGYFHCPLRITAVPNAFGGTEIEAQLSWVGAETGKVYRRFDLEGILGAKQYEFSIGATSSTCAGSLKCRFVASSEMLLCAWAIVDARPSCRNSKGDSDEIAQFLGFVRPTKPASYDTASKANVKPLDHWSP